MIVYMCRVKGNKNPYTAKNKIILKGVATMTNNNNKKTKRDFYLELLEIAETIEQKDFINRELDLLERKRINSATRRNSNTEENELIAQTIIDYYEENPNTVATCGQLIKILQEKNLQVKKELSTSRISAIMAKICGKVDEPIENAPIKRMREKRTMYFIKA